MAAPFIFDVDPGIDDTAAFLYAAHHGAEIAAATVTHGNVPVEVGTRNALTVLDYLGLQDVPVYKGAHRPMAQPLDTAEFVHGNDGLGDCGIVPSTRSATPGLAAAEIVRLAHERPGELSIIAVGPMTNIGLALLMDAELPSLIKDIVLMGGSINTPGNSSPVAEANIWHDPEAMQLILDAGWDVSIAGLEMTMDTQFPEKMVNAIRESNSPRAKFFAPMMDTYINTYQAVYGYPTVVIHDAVSVAIHLDPSLAEFKLVNAEVELRGSATRGQTIADLRKFMPEPTDPKSPGTMRYITDFDTETFHVRFMESLGIDGYKP